MTTTPSSRPIHLKRRMAATSPIRTATSQMLLMLRRYAGGICPQVKVLGVHNGMVLEYDPSTLAPLGLVVGKDELMGRKVAVVDSGIETQSGEDYEKLPDREQAVILYDDDMHVTVVQPNEDGSYWRKIVRNKVVRMKEKRREAAAMRFMKRNYQVTAGSKVDIQSSWGSLHFN